MGIPCTIVGSLQCPEETLHREVVRLVVARQNGEPIDEHVFEDRVTRAIARVVQEQIAIGMQAISNGGIGQSSFMDYIADGRFGGVRRSGKGQSWLPRDVAEHPSVWEVYSSTAIPHLSGIELVGKVAYQDLTPVQQEISRFRATLAQQGASGRQAFLCAVSPGTIADQLWDWENPSPYYSTYSDLLHDCALAMRMEYQEIARRGLTLQVDAPDLAISGQYLPPDGVEGYRRQLQERIAAINLALAGLDQENIRVHVCWGNWMSTHEFDIPLVQMLDLLLALPGALSIEAANPAHEAEWEAFKGVAWPPGKPLLYGVIDTKTLVLETPSLVAQRLVRIAEIIGKEHVWASTDCGFASFVGRSVVPADISWLKLKREIEGAQLASQTLWP